MSGNTLPQSLQNNPRLSTWIAFEAPDGVRVSTGKVEIGQGVLSALAQIAAEELDVDFDQMRVLSGQTGETPEEGITAGSFSIDHSGGAIRLACAEIRALFLARAAERLACPVTALSLERGRILRDGAPTALDYWALRDEVSLDRDATGSAPTKRPAEYRIVGRDAPRFDLRAKVTGGAFIHDMTLPGMAHARVLHAPRRNARLANVDLDRALRAGGVEVVREADLIALVGEDESQVMAAHARATASAQWEGGTAIAPPLADARALMTQTARDIVDDLGPAPPAGADIVTATYSKPYLAHGSIGPSCGVALFENGKLTVWSHSQGVGVMIPPMAKRLGIAPEAITVHHTQSAGCYGHNGADDAAFEAAFIALRKPGVPIRVQWTRAEELAVAPCGSAMVTRASAALGPDKRPVSWTTEIWSGTHSNRPAQVNGGFIADALLTGPVAFSDFELRLANGGGASRCAVPSYAFPMHQVITHMIADLPLRTSAHRGLGTFANVFATESFMDELALAAGEDPVAYRLSCVTDPRARRVIEQAAAMAGWRASEPGGEGQGRGFAFSRYKNVGAYFAIALEVVVEERVRVTKVWCALDAGLAISPDGVRNQIEGGIIQAISWALFEAIPLGDGAVAIEGWADYPILRFSDVPEIDIALVGQIDDKPLGVGEAATGPTGAAVANAVAHALGVRIRDLPLTRERIETALAG